MKKHLPTFEFVIDENSPESGVKAVSIVDDPAFQSSLVAFNKEKPKFVQFVDTKGKKKKQICAGLSLIPNMLVYRIDPMIGEYYGYFSAETIEKIVEKYHEELNTNKVNLNHDENKYIDAFMVSDYIVDSAEKVEDLKRMGIEHENIMGSWYTAFKIKDPKVFEQIINGSAKTGFSVEAFLDTYLVRMNNNMIENKVKSEMKKNNKSILEKIISLFKDEIFERGTVSELGFDIEWQDVGQPVLKINVAEDGTETTEPVGPGEFATDMGIVVVDENSNLVEVRELPVEPEEPEVEIQIEESAQTEVEAKDYPWDQCISDQIAAGYTQDVADKICGYIRSKNMKKDELTEDLIKEIIASEECLGCKKKDEEFTKLSLDDENIKLPDPKSEEKPIELSATEKLSQEIEKQKIEFAKLQAKFDEVVKENEALKVENDTLKDKMKEPIGEPILEAPVEQKPWDKMNAYEKAVYRAKIK